MRATRSFERLRGPIAADLPPDKNGVRYYRLLIKIVDGVHTVYVSNDSTRIFTPDTLPLVLKHRLAIIKSRPQTENKKDEWASSMLEVFTHPPHVKTNEEMQLIGWQSTEIAYIVIVSEGELDYIRIST